MKKNINGMLLLDKAQGISSNTAMQQAKRLYQAAKAGHTGSLDPLATGMLPICFGEATKFAQYLLAADKQYEALIKLGVATTTGDAEGEMIANCAVPCLEQKTLDTVAQKFLGKQMQMPPMYSALKHQGRPLYEYARQGIHIEREKRQIEIFNLQLVQQNGSTLFMQVHCSKGTYVRTLAEDIGTALNCVAHLISLRRITVADFAVEKMRTLAALATLNEDERMALLLPMDAMLLHFPSIVLNDEEQLALWQGKVLPTDRYFYKNAETENNLFRLYNLHNDFLGLGEIAENFLRAKRLLNLSALDEKRL